MGEIADILINGEFDYITGEYIGGAVWYPRTAHKKYKETHSYKQFRTIRKEIALRTKELIESGQNENGALNKARAEANQKYGHEWRNLQYC